MLGGKEDADAEWVVYRLKNGSVRAASKARWDLWQAKNPLVWKDIGDELIAEGLKKEDAMRFMELTK